MSMKKKLGQIISSKSRVETTYTPPPFVGNDEKPLEKTVPVLTEKEKENPRKSVDII